MRRARSDAEVAGGHQREREVVQKNRLREQQDLASRGARLRRSSLDALKKTEAKHREATAQAAGADMLVQQLTGEVQLLERMLVCEAVRGDMLAHVIQASLSREVISLERAIHRGRGTGVGLLERAKRGRDLTEQLQLDRLRIPSSEVSNHSGFSTGVWRSFEQRFTRERCLSSFHLYRRRGIHRGPHGDC